MSRAVEHARGKTTSLEAYSEHENITQHQMNMLFCFPFHYSKHVNE